jgi:ParB family chromosome partitioning protein
MDPPEDRPAPDDNSDDVSRETSVVTDATAESDVVGPTSEADGAVETSSGSTDSELAADDAKDTAIAADAEPEAQNDAAVTEMAPVPDGVQEPADVPAAPASEDVGASPDERDGEHAEASTGDAVDAVDPGTVAGPATSSSATTASVVDEQDGLVPVPGASFAELPVNSIRPNPRQPRTVFDEGELDELVGSIKEIGVLQPVVVRPAPDEPGQYELIMGARRWRATQTAGLEVIPAIVRVTDDEDLLRDALLENLHRSALNPLEEAAAYRQLLDDFGCTHDELALRISRSRPQISNTLRLLRLPPLVQRRVAAGVLSAGHARALLGLSDGAAIERLAQRIVSEGLSVRATEEIVALGVGDEKAPQHRPRAGQRSEAVDELASRLSDRFETRVRVDLGKSKGKVTIEFASVEDLNRILDVMAPEDPGLLRR